MQYFHVPSNDELEANAPDSVHEALKGWLARHTKPMNGPFWTQKDLNWAATNLMIDPEVRGAYKKQFGDT